MAMTPVLMLQLFWIAAVTVPPVVAIVIVTLRAGWLARRRRVRGESRIRPALRLAGISCAAALVVAAPLAFFAIKLIRQEIESVRAAGGTVQVGVDDYGTRYIVSYRRSSNAVNMTVVDVPNTSAQLETLAAMTVIGGAVSLLLAWIAFFAFDRGAQPKGFEITSLGEERNAP